jgi:hypothetical protein
MKVGDIMRFDNGVAMVIMLIVGEEELGPDGMFRVPAVVLMVEKEYVTRFGTFVYQQGRLLKPYSNLLKEFK